MKTDKGILNQAYLTSWNSEWFTCGIDNMMITFNIKKRTATMTLISDDDEETILYLDYDYYATKFKEKLGVS